MITKKRLEPLDDRILVKPADAASKSPGGILLPDNAQKKPQRGQVLAVGPGKRLNTGERSILSVDVGDEVIYADYTGLDIEIDEQEVKILCEGEILAKVVSYLESEN